MIEKLSPIVLIVSVIKRLAVTSGALALLFSVPVMSPIPARAEIVLDQAQESNLIGGTQAGGIFGAAQTFTVGVAGILAQVDLDLLWSGSAPNPADLTVRILGTTPAGGPDNSAVFGSKVIPGSMLDRNVPTWVSVDLSASGIVVFTGDVLAIELTGPDTISWRLGNGYPGGIYFVDIGTGWVDNASLNPAFAENDHTFRTYVEVFEPGAVLDQYQGSNTTTDYSLSGSLRRAQTFTVGLSGLLAQVDVPIAGAGPGDVTIRILGTNSLGEPNDADVLGSATILSSVLNPSEHEWVSVDLRPAGIRVEEGKVLAIELSSPDTVFWRVGSGYADGIFFLNNGESWRSGATFPGSGDLDMAFRTYVDIDQSVFAFTKIADTATPVPDGSGTFTYFGSPSIDEGNVAYSGVGGAGWNGICKFSAATETLTTVADKFTAIPGGSSGFYAFSSTVSISGEDVAFMGFYFDDAGVYRPGIYTEVAGSLSAVIESGDPVPGLPGAGFYSFIYPSIDKGEVAMLGYSIHPETGERIQGIYVTNNGTLDVVADSLNTLVPGGAGDFGWLLLPSIDSGKVTFSGYSGSKGYGVYRLDGGSLTVMADNSTANPEGYGNFTYAFYGSSDGSDVVFIGGSPAGIYKNIGGDIAPVATISTPVPGGEGIFRGFGAPAIDNGKVAFYGSVYRASDGSYGQGVYTDLGGRLEKVLATDDSLDGKTVSRVYSAWEALSGSSIAMQVVFSDGTQGIYVASRDGDNDMVPDDQDNCPITANNDQADTDGDGIGDVCQDTDADGVLDTDDNCPAAPNPDQIDSDGDLFGDVCDICPDINDPDQADADGDGFGNACDPDADDDGFTNAVDLCPLVPDDQSDLDGDGLGDNCDDDIDGDGIANAVDGTFDGADFTDESRSFSGNFTDAHTGSMVIGYGTVSQRDGSLAFLINDSENVNEGLKIDTLAGEGILYVKLCGFSQPWKLQGAGTSLTITCGSQTLNVRGAVNPVEFAFAPNVIVRLDSGARATIDEVNGALEVRTATESGQDAQIAIGDDTAVTVPAASAARITEQTAGQFEIQNSPDSLQPITVKIHDQVIEYGPGDRAVPVSIDIKPGSDYNCLNNDGKGAIPVAILSSVNFNATQVDPSKVYLDGQAVRSAGKNGNTQAHTEDVNGDGLDDLMLQIEDINGTYEEGDTQAQLTGETFAGTPIRGADSLCIVP